MLCSSCSTVYLQHFLRPCLQTANTSRTNLSAQTETSNDCVKTFWISHVTKHLKSEIWSPYQPSTNIFALSWNTSYAILSTSCLPSPWDSICGAISGPFVSSNHKSLFSYDTYSKRVVMVGPMFAVRVFTTLPVSTVSSGLVCGPHMCLLFYRAAWFLHHWTEPGCDYEQNRRNKHFALSWHVQEHLKEWQAFVRQRPGWSDFNS